MKTRARGMIVVFSLAALAWVGCQKEPTKRAALPPAASSSSAGEIAALVDGEPVLTGKVDDAAKGQIQKIQSQMYQVRKRALDEIIDNMLIEKAAQQEGMNTEEYLDKYVTSKVEPPTDEEIQAFYDQKKGQIRAPLDQVRERVIEYLKSSRLNAKRQELVAGLQKKAKVRILLQPPRVEISMDGAAFTAGDKNAGIVLAEFSDYQCPYSKRAQSTVRLVRDEYKDKIYYAFVDFPLPFHKNAMKAAQAARCAGDQGKYEQYGQKLFDNQKNLGVEDLKKYANELGLDTKAFDSCLDSGKFAAEVQQSIRKGQQAGVTGTPAFFINGIMISGAQPIDSFKQIIEAEQDR